MDGSEGFNFSIEVVPQEIEALLEYAEVSKDEVDYFVLHQANRYMVHNIGKRLKVDLERCPVESFGAFGNISSARPFASRQPKSTSMTSDLGPSRRPRLPFAARVSSCDVPSSGQIKATGFLDCGYNAR